jgi:hypothetical protein
VAKRPDSIGLIGPEAAPAMWFANTGLMGLPVNEGELERALELSAPYGRDHAKAIAGLVEHFKRVVFPEA